MTEPTDLPTGDQRPFLRRHLSTILVLAVLVLFTAGAVIFNAARDQEAAPPPPAAATTSPADSPPSNARELATAVTAAMERAGRYRVDYVPNESARFDPVEGVVVLSGGAVSLDLTVKKATEPGGPLHDFRFVATESGTFVRLPAVFSAPAGKPWTALTRDAKDATATMLATAFDLAVETAVPAANWMELLAAAGRITGTTRAETRGVPVTRYTLTLDLDRAASRLTTPRLAGMRKVDVELDVADNLPLALAVTTPGQPVTERVSYTAWGQPATITPPPPGEIHQR